jgi:hypothetical protein
MQYLLRAIIRMVVYLLVMLSITPLAIIELTLEIGGRDENKSLTRKILGKLEEMI